MSRELKFRAWDPKFNVMLNGICPYGNDNVLVVDVEFNDAYGDRVDARDKSGVEQGGPEHVCICDGLIIQQFSGLTDKNGVDIYEGDIVKTDFKQDGSHESIQVIEFYEGAFGSRDKADHFRIPALFSGRAVEGMNVNYYEVIGDIYRNPNLTKEVSNEV